MDSRVGSILFCRVLYGSVGLYRVRYGLESKLFNEGCIGDCIGDYYEAY